MAYHYTVANTVCANGAKSVPGLGLEGAAPPYLIISHQSEAAADPIDDMNQFDRDEALSHQTEEDIVDISESILQGWFDAYQVGKKDDLVNVYGFRVRVTPSGSMLKRTFYDFVVHFSKHLPHDQGPNGKGVVLFLDWHGSRACPKVMAFALKSNVLIFIFPSKASLWCQLCDVGENLAVSVSISAVAQEKGILETSAMSYEVANKVFREGLQRHVDEQVAELVRTGANVAYADACVMRSTQPHTLKLEGIKGS